MNHAYLLTGGNLGDREHNLATARQSIRAKCGIILRQSALYETAAWGKTDQPAFLNQALLLDTPLPAQELMHQLLDIEQKMGRIREEKNGPRVVDIDILLFNDTIIHETSLTIPHPRMQDRRFVLVPLAEIAPAKVHPLLGKTILDLLTICTDPLAVKLYR